MTIKTGLGDLDLYSAWLMDGNFSDEKRKELADYVERMVSQRALKSYCSTCCNDRDYRSCEMLCGGFKKFKESPRKVIYTL